MYYGLLATNLQKNQPFICLPSLLLFQYVALFQVEPEMNVDQLVALLVDGSSPTKYSQALLCNLIMSVMCYHCALTR